MRYCLDVDGCLANFYQAYEDMCIEVDGQDLFRDAKWPQQYPQVWDWPEAAGYSVETMKEVWRRIKESKTFWSNLAVLEKLPYGLMRTDQVYFVTDRPGATAQYQTHLWLEDKVYGCPNVIMSNGRSKGDICAALGIDVAVDDRAENVIEIEIKSPGTRAYLLNRPYNKDAVVKRRAASMKDVAEKEWLK